MQPSGFGTRPPTSGTQFGYNRPPSATGAAGFGAPGTASRRQQSPWVGGGSAQQPAAAIGVSLNTSVEVTARPVVMREGVKGMHVPSQQQTGTRRQVMDRSYHLGQLRSKISELTSELGRLREEEQRLQKNAGQMSAIGGKMKTLDTDVQKLKSELSDLNFAVEKSAGGVDVERLHEEALELKEVVKQEKTQTDYKFMERQKCEEKFKLVSMQVAELTTKLESKLSDEPHRRSEYYRLREDSAGLAANVFIKEKELGVLNQRYETLLLQMKADPQKQLQFQQQEKLMRLQQHVDQLTNEFNGDLEAEKKQLLAQVKADVTSIDTIQAGIRESKAELEEAKAKLKSLEADLQELTGDRMGKYKQLEQRDQEMQVSIDNFDSDKAKQLNSNGETESSIVDLLEHIGDTLKSGNAAEKLKQMQTELELQKTQVGESKSTHERLKKELEDRKNELKKVKNLDEKISTELEITNKCIAENEEAMGKYGDLEGLRKEHEQKKEHLTSRRVYLADLSVALKRQVQQLNAEYETRRDDLQCNDVHQPLQLQEQKVRQLRQNLFQLEEFIKQKTSETAFMPIKAECLRMIEETNAFLQDPKRLDKAAVRGKGF